MGERRIGLHDNTTAHALSGFKTTFFPRGMSMFGFRLPSALILDRSNTFRLKYEACDNLLFGISQLPL